MKKLLMIICLTTLCAHGFTQEEEARNLIRELVEGGTDRSTTKESWERRHQLFSDLRAFNPDVVFSAYYETLGEKFDDLNYVNFILKEFFDFDGRDIVSYGRQEALDWTRKLLREKKQGQGLDRPMAIWYLRVKGDERDLDLIPIQAWREELAMRVAGTNLINYWKATYPTGAAWLGCAPSVTNTGPQGAYVQAILRQFWENMEIEIEEGTESWPQPAKFRDSAKIPPELLTMVVWFDAGGNPVCNVDLAKYGLAMPEIDLPPKVKDEILRRSSGSAGLPPCNAGDAGQKPCAPGTTAPWRTPLLIGVAVLIIGGGIYAWRKISKR
ncbi:MAG: hypothetical protein FWG50_13905 [Kiritimatiellaeota bacterium]|nr:hypothetical protein [Kiritimatiellota bacterium]